MPAGELGAHQIAGEPNWSTCPVLGVTRRLVVGNVRELPPTGVLRIERHAVKLAAPFIRLQQVVDGEKVERLRDEDDSRDTLVAKNPQAFVDDVLCCDVVSRRFVVRTEVADLDIVARTVTVEPLRARALPLNCQQDTVVLASFDGADLLCSLHDGVVSGAGLWEVVIPVLPECEGNDADDFVYHGGVPFGWDRD